VTGVQTCALPISPKPQNPIYMLPILLFNLSVDVHSIIIKIQINSTMTSNNNPNGDKKESSSQQ